MPTEVGDCPVCGNTRVRRSKKILMTCGSTECARALQTVAHVRAAEEKRKNRPPDPAEKTCTQCGETKVLDRYNFKPRAGKRFGWEPRCRDCIRAESRDRYRRDAVRRALENPVTPTTERTCKPCGETKRLDKEHFGIMRRSASGEIVAYDYYCRDCRRRLRREAYAKDEQAREIHKARMRELHAEKMRDPKKAEELRVKARERHRKWREKNPEKYLANQRRYQERLKADPVRHAARLEKMRIDGRLRTERDGKKIRVARKRNAIEVEGRPRLRVEPFREWLLKLDDSPENLELKLGIPARSLRRIIGVGEGVANQFVELDLVDRAFVAVGAPQLMDEVYSEPLLAAA